ncbi:hypothetical protein J416_05738 [Gracilibacillus halophilus YIM-C55.5]|uniref:DUF2624 domain-containing protein n=1 Tax=Gracilibacillus halophilus YIM-C55.5 TaxID=1308866 RepID=N4WB24_9BACI|nr:DUF2624 family protein [Gracilibacillus halophilus]ENH97488.1 hypothetical protein J416_05738 [Gracilibacillus halophilus YIM-C55.5]
MDGITKHLIQKKLSSLTDNEILKYAQKYNIPLQPKQANLIVQQLQSNRYNPLDANDRAQMFKKLAQITDINTAKACQKLFNELIREYGFEHLFR